MLRSTGFLAISLILSSVGSGPVLANQMYWTDKDDFRIRRGDMDGSSPPVVLLSTADGLGIPQGIGLDVAGGKMYWADSQHDHIRRANLDGTGRQTLIDTGMTFPADLELDLTAGKIYWTDMLQGEIRRADLSGDNVQVLYTGLNLPYYFELDTAGGKIYWAENDNEVIHVSAMDGSGHITDLNVGIDRIRDVGLDVAAGKIYWGERTSHTVLRCNLSGTGRETLFDSSDGLDRPHGMALDIDAGMAYWTDTRTYAIHRGNMDGSESVESLYTGLVSPWDIELDVTPIPEPSTLVLAVVGALGVLVCAWRRGNH